MEACAAGSRAAPSATGLQCRRAAPGPCAAAGGRAGPASRPHRRPAPLEPLALVVPPGVARSSSRGASALARSSSSSNGATSVAAASSSDVRGADASAAGPSGAGPSPSGGVAPRAGSGLRRDEFFAPGSEGEARQRLFDSIAPVYDQLNDSLSLGLHRLWKRMTVQWSGAAPGHAALDVCCGSGDLALLLAEAVGPAGAVTGLDFSAAMLEDARRRAGAGGGGAGRAPLRWVQGDALRLPFAPASFDAATMGYGLRNVADIPLALRELHRVLKPGGTVAILDFNNAGDNFFADQLQAFYLSSIVVPAATAQGLEEEYRYLRPSIQRFPAGRQQEQLAREAGFRKAAHYAITFGQMGVLVATK